MRPDRLYPRIGQRMQPATDSGTERKVTLYFCRAGGRGAVLDAKVTQHGQSIRLTHHLLDEEPFHIHAFVSDPPLGEEERLGMLYTSNAPGVRWQLAQSCNYVHGRVCFMEDRWHAGILRTIFVAPQSEREPVPGTESVTHVCANFWLVKRGKDPDWNPEALRQNLRCVANAARMQLCVPFAKTGSQIANGITARVLQDMTQGQKRKAIRTPTPTPVSPAHAPMLHDQAPIADHSHQLSAVQVRVAAPLTSSQLAGARQRCVTGVRVYCFGGQPPPTDSPRPVPIELTTDRLRHAQHSGSTALGPSRLPPHGVSP